MIPMKSLSLIVCLILTGGYLSPAQAVSDAELEALEKQIEQLEAKEKKAEAEAKRKAKAEAKRMAEAEAEKQAEEKRKQEAEDKRLAEEEMKRQEKEVKKRAEEEKKEKYTLLITEAEQAINNKDKVLAISKYEKALVLYPDDNYAANGILEAKKLKHKLCYEVLGAWIWDNKYTLNIRENGTFTGTGISERTWNCSDPENRTIELDIPLATMIAILSADGKCLKASNLFSEGCL
jgi:hypothetical protein